MTEVKRRRALGIWLALTLPAACSDPDPSEPSSPCSRSSSGRVVCGDFGNALGTIDGVFVTGRLVREEAGYDPATSPPSHDLEQDELPDVDLQLRLVDADRSPLATFEATTDEEGWIAERLPLAAHELEPGEYWLEVHAGEHFAAQLRVRLLPRDSDALVVLSDIDLTYLNTDFQSTDAILALLEQDATERETLPAMELAYRELRAGASGDQARPLVFLSGSPLFFRRTLAGKAQLDEVDEDGILLKPLTRLILHELLEDLDVGDLGSALLGDTDALLGSVTDQLGYKLTGALAQQLNVPVDTGLLLLGDDSESDHIVYALLHRYLAREVDDAELMDILDDLDVDDVWLDAIRIVGPEVLRARGDLPSPVRAIFINRTQVANTEEPAEAWAIPELSRLHQGAWPLILELHEEGWVSRASVTHVGERLLELGQTTEALDAAALAGVASGFLDPASAALGPR